MWGFKVIEWFGLWDMPSRKGEITYDWGDEIQPLVDDEDIIWNSRKFKLKALFDKRINGNDFEQIKKQIEKAGKFVLPNPFKDCMVQINSFKVLKENSVCAVCEFEFYEKEVTFEAVLPMPSGMGSTIDGYSLYKDLGIYFTFDKDQELAELKDLRNTVFKKGTAKSQYRELPEITLKCFSKEIKPVQKILSGNGLRELYRNGITYKCFFTKGFKVTKKINGFSYEIKLSVYEII